MLRILVADDEQIVIDGITHILNTYNPTFEVKTARTGREAIQIAESFHPNAIFMDIKMPGIDGLEALEEIHKSLPQALLIIISAYEQFEYARSAINLQVLEYLVKPVNKELFIGALNKIENILRERDLERQKNLGIREKYQKLLPIFEQDLVLRFISGIDQESLIHYQDLLQSPSALYSFLILQLDLDKDLPGEILLDTEFTNSQQLNSIRQLIRLELGCLVGPVRANSLAILSPLQGNDEYQARISSISIAENILEYTNNNARIGVGKAYEFQPELGHSYNEALLALDSATPGSIQHYMDLIGTDSPNWENSLQDFEDNILEAIGQGRPERIQEAFSHRIMSFLQLESEVLERFSQRLWEICILAIREARKHGFKEDIRVPSLPEELTHESIQQKYIPHILSLVTHCARYIYNKRTSRLNSVVDSAKTYIDQHFKREDLYLEEIARHACVTPYYLSRLFHSEMGMTITDYLTKVRLEHAIKILEDGTSIKEVCYRVGYNDPNYFSRLFRKIYGVPPTEYRRKSEG